MKKVECNAKPKIKRPNVMKDRFFTLNLTKHGGQKDIN